MKTSGKAETNDERLPVASLRLLAPPLRLVSAAVWKVMQQRDVMHYGKLEEFVTSVSETVPGLLSYRHQAKLTVGLQARLILDQLRMSQSPDPELILPQLERLHPPTLSKGKRKDQKVEMAVKNFHTLVHTLLKSPALRRQFFQEEFDSQYGPQYDSALEKLLWEFLTRLDQLLPVPDLAQTVSWLSAAPAVLEECARSATQPQLLRTLLQHEKCLGHLDSAASIPSSTGDSILSSLSLPPSGRVRHTNRSGSAPVPNLALSPATSTEKSSSRQSSRTVSQIAPVIGTISGKELTQRTLGRDSENELINKDASSYTRTKLRSCPASEILENVPEEEHFVGNMLVTVVSQTPTSSEAEDTDEAQLRPVRRSAQRRSSSTRALEQDRKIKEERLEDDSKTCSGTAQDIVSHEGKHLPAVLASCMKRQLRVVIPRLDIRDVTQLVSLNSMNTMATTASEEQITKSPKSVIHRARMHSRNADSVNRKRKLDCTWTPEKSLSGTTDKQVCAGSPCIPTVMLARMDSSEKASPVNESTDDIVVDSEDEATENVKGRLFSTRYCKTKNNTYVPTLHEFWTPVFFRRDLVSPGNGYR
ncbi:LOW QUALITY PROTEIN: TERF1-interacting nuclear factor 2 [Colossoma macropomum]|uniref:LOW QUALITY PROTEIN: TERF1-interacting nuclear factor 2 n=1 Tax=Colossoma macropomum TaxID=42526 RepID=UPI0018654E34|nr:LOW QUALITY PROTEIN: TERF1-interacting nuclear factor 2 [Colossoma macropomum]